MYLLYLYISNLGKVLSGMDIVRLIEYNPTDSDDRPIKPVVITACDVIDLEPEEYFVVDKEPLNCQQ